MSYDVRANRAEINRLTKAIAAEEQNINAAFQRMGQNYFAAHRNDPEESQKANVQAVQEAMQRANAYKDQINVLRGIAICPSCKSEVDISAAFCSRCGTRMPAQAKPAAPGACSCPNCGNACAPGTRFCNQCGARLPEAAPAAPVVPAASYAAPVQMPPEPVPASSYAPIPEPTPAPSYAPIPEPVFTPPQNTVQPPVFQAVTELEPAAPAPEPEPVSNPIPEPEPVAEPLPEQPAAPAQKFCANCGTPLDPEYRFCLECGTPVQ